MRLSAPLAGVLVSAIAMAVLPACAPDAPQPKRTTTASTPTKPVSLDVAELPRGDKPKIAWGHGARLDGDPEQEVLPADLNEFARTRQLLVVSDVDNHVFAYAPEGPRNQTAIGTTTGSLAMNAKRNMVAWIAPDGSPTILQEGHAKPVTLPAPNDIDGGNAVGVLGDDCFNGPETVEGAGCSVFFSAADEEAKSFVASNHGFVDEAAHGIKGLTDADDDGMVGWSKVNNDMSTCSIHRGSGSPKQGAAWSTCDHLPLEFSPDGAHVLATGPHGIEGLGTGELSILDRSTGEPALTVHTLDDDAAFIAQMTWEDAENVLAVVFQKGEWSVVRVGLGGAMDIAVQPLKGDETEVPFRLSVQP